MLLGYDIYKGALSEIDLSHARLINTINPHSFCIAEQDSLFKSALTASHVLLPDGIGIVWAEKVINKNRIKKIAGYDLFIFLLDKLNRDSGSCFFLGASKETLKKIEVRLKGEYPNIAVNSYSPPFKPEFSAEDSLEMCSMVNQCKPKVLFVGMTAPKQEKWIFKNHHNLKADTICAIGAVFDFYAGNVKRSNQFWINLGLEWLPRFLKEPKRLAQRNLVSTPKFIFSVLKAKLRA